MDPELFRQAVLALRETGLPFWADYGTLLGLVREGRVLPHDGDFDFGLWDGNDAEERVAAAFRSRGFTVEPLTPWGKKALHARPPDGPEAGEARTERGLVDVTFYAREGDRAIHRSCAPRDSLSYHLLTRVDRFLDPRLHASETYKRVLERAFHASVPPRLTGSLRASIERRLRARYAGGIPLTYDYPARLLDDLRPAPFLGIEVPIPRDAEAYLALAYGADWRTPKRWARWYEGATTIGGRRNV